jgi:anti-anti-sigma factor
MDSRTVVMKLPHRVDAREARTLLRELKELPIEEPCVVVDLSAVRHMDSAALDVLLGCMVEVARRDGAMRLGGISPEAATVLELTRMDKVFDMFPSAAEAVWNCNQLEQKVEDSRATAQIRPQVVAA